MSPPTSECTPVVRTQRHSRFPIPATEESLVAAIDRVLVNPPTITESGLERFAIDSIVARYLALAD